MKNKNDCREGEEGEEGKVRNWNFFFWVSGIGIRRGIVSGEWSLETQVKEKNKLIENKWGRLK